MSELCVIDLPEVLILYYQRLLIDLHPRSNFGVFSWLRRGSWSAACSVLGMDKGCHYLTNLGFGGHTIVNVGRSSFGFRTTHRPQKHFVLQYLWVWVSFGGSFWWLRCGPLLGKKPPSIGNHMWSNCEPHGSILP